jgi:hypothetical protein
MTTYQNALDYVKDQMQQGKISADQANVKVIQMIGVKLIEGKIPMQVRKVLNAAVKNGELGHIKKEGLKPEAYHHINARARALDMRQSEYIKGLEAIKAVCC